VRPFLTIEPAASYPLLITISKPNINISKAVVCPASLRIRLLVKAVKGPSESIALTESTLSHMSHMKVNEKNIVATRWNRLKTAIEKPLTVTLPVTARRMEAITPIPKSAPLATSRIRDRYL